MAAKTIQLSRMYEAHGSAFDTLTLREPTGADYWHVGGRPREWQPLGEGVALITHFDRVKAYAERIAGDNAPARLAVLDLADTMKVEAAVLDFFTEAMRSNEPSTSSSGTPAKA